MKSDVVYQKRRVDVVSLEALTAAGYDIDDGNQGERGWIAEIRTEDILARLSPRQREAVLLYADGYGGREVREQLGISKVSLCRLMSRARRQIRVYLKLSEQT